MARRERGPAAGTVAQRLARFAIQLELESVPSATLDKARLCLLDGLGAMLAGSRTETGAIARGLVDEVGGLPQASVLGSGLRTSAAWAALANGMQAHSLEVDDGHRYAIGLHNAATTLPAALAAAEWRGSSGREFLTALIAGYEVASRIGRAINPSHRYLGFHSTGTVGCFGATTAAARLLGLDAAQTARALGIAGSLAGGIFEFLSDGSTVKHLHAGAAAQHGVVAALLAARGLTGPLSVIEGAEGFLHAFARDADASSISTDLGQRWELDNVYFKLYAACAHCFAPIDAALELRDELRGRSVRRVVVETYRAAALLDHSVVATRQEAKFSVPYCVAAALTLGQATEEAFEPAALADPRIASLARRVEVVEAEHLTADFPRTRAAKLCLELEGGDQLTRQVDVPRGMPEGPVVGADVVRKFEALVRGPIGAERAAALIAASQQADGSPILELISLARD